MVVDSSGWLEFFKGGPLAGRYEEYLRAPDLLVPTIVLYEVYKVLRRDVGESEALLGAARLKTAEIIPLDERIALEAAEISLQHGLAMADAIVYASARARGAILVTGDRHFEGMEGVEYIAG